MSYLPTLENDKKKDNFNVPKTKNYFCILWNTTKKKNLAPTLSIISPTSLHE